MLLLLASASALSATTAFVGAKVLPVEGASLDFGVILVEDGKIVAIGAPNDVTIPEDATTIEVRGKVIVPGLVDTHSHIATTGDLHEKGITPGVSAIDAIDATHDSIQRAQAGGVTTANIMPGSGSLIGGQTAYVKLRDVTTVDKMLICDDRRAEICGGMKMANGTNPQGRAGLDGRMGAAYQQRKAFLDAGGRRDDDSGKKKKKKKKSEPEKPDAKDLNARAMAEVLDGDRVVHFHTHRADDVVTALGLAEEFGLELVLHHVSEAWKVVDELTEAEAAVSLIIVDSPGGKEEATEIHSRSAPMLERADVPVALHTDDPITDSRLFLRMGGMAVRAGMSPEGALAALTIRGAEMLGLADRIGSLEVGKDADLVVLSGDPFSVWTKVEQTWIDGRIVFDRSVDSDRAWAVGGRR